MAIDDTSLKEDLFQKFLKSKDTQKILLNEGIKTSIVELGLKNDLEEVRLERYINQEKTLATQLADVKNKIIISNKKIRDDLKLDKIKKLKKTFWILLAIHIAVLIYLIIDFLFLDFFSKHFSILDNWNNIAIAGSILFLYIVIQVSLTIKYSQLNKQYFEVRKSEKNDKRVISINKEIEKIHTEIEDSFKEKFNNSLIENINRYRNSLNANRIESVSFGNLSEVFKSSDRVITNGFKRINSLINRIPGGCIGLSGKRGIGKTTILKMIKSELLTLEGSHNLLHIYSTAPVNYNIRDFILYIFYSVGYEYLSLKGVEYTSPPIIKSVKEGPFDRFISFFLMQE